MKFTQRASNKVSDIAQRLARGVAALRLRQTQTSAQRLGYGPGARLLIVHADDLGIARTANDAFISGHATGLINSGSVMVPGPCFGQIATFVQSHSDADIGIHLTLTRERSRDEWTPLADRTKVSSLVDKHGFLLQEWPSAADIRPREVEIELRAQVDRAYAAGLRPTHLDSHQFRLQFGGRDLFEVYLRIGREYHLPVLVSREWFSKFPYLQPALSERDIVVDRVVTISSKVSPDEWPEFYRHTLDELPPGVTELLIHPGYDGDELRSFFEGRLPWGAAWRQRDFDFFTSEEFRGQLAKHDITLINWREIISRLQ